MGQPSRSTVDQKRSSGRKRSVPGSDGGQWESDPNKNDTDRKGVVEENEWMGKAEIARSEYGEIPVVVHSGECEYRIQMA